MNRPRPVPPLPAGEERLEDAFGVGRRDARAAIQHFQQRPFRGGDAAGADLDRRHWHRFAAVLQCVLAQIPQQLMQMRGIDAHFEVRRRGGDAAACCASTCAVWRNSARKSSSQPFSSMRSWPRRVPPRQLQDIVDDRADPLAVVGDDVRQAPLLRRERAAPRRAIARRDSSRRPGLRISCAMLALSRPSAASLDC